MKKLNLLILPSTSSALCPSLQYPGFPSVAPARVKVMFLEFRIIIGDPHGCLIGDPHIFIGDPQIFILDPPDIRWITQDSRWRTPYFHW